MKPEEQRIAIAEACNWPPYRFGATWITTGWLEIHGLDGTRDYLNDLNAMHEAEGKLSEDQWDQMFSELISICWRDAGATQRKGRGQQKVLSPSRATAKQRAEAFLRALNLWKD